MKRHLAILLLTVSIVGLVACAGSPGVSSRPVAAPNAVTDWASIIQPAIHNASEPRSPAGSFLLHTMAQLAVYNAVVAIEGGHEPYRTTIAAPKGADLRAAVATAAYRTVRARVAPSQLAYLDERYGAYLKDVPQGRARTDGVDAAIAGFEAKYFYRAWRPRTAIPRAAEDANSRTDPDPAWTPLLTINHPEYPSAHAFASSAVTTAVAAFFGTDKVEWTIVTSKEAVPQLAQTTRIYQSLNALMEDVHNARVWAGLHYRNSMVEGGALGSAVAKHVTKNYFHPRS